jgi:hypothetical protein
MPVLTEAIEETTLPPVQAAPVGLRAYFSNLATEPPAPWNAVTAAGLASLVAIWAAWFYGTWATWGYLTADCGREMYVPVVLSQGKTLYKDIWYLYGPAGPYFNSFLYHLFGVHLSVLYWAGSLSALGSAIFLYLAGMRLSTRLVGWTAGAILLTQSFHHSLFSFPLPYSFASVYGCFAACVFLWLLICAANSRRSAWVFGAGTAAAVALLLKLEIGAACYFALVLLIAARWLRERCWKRVAIDVAVCLPGVLVCGAVLLWMISLGGVEFLTQENIMSWPTSFFMRTYGKFWLAATGLSLSAKAFLGAAKRTVIFFGVSQGFLLLLSWKRTARRLIVMRTVLFAGALLYLALYLRSINEVRFGPPSLPWQDAIRCLFFPQDMVLYIGIVALLAWWHFCTHASDGRPAALPLIFSFSVLLAFRTLLMTTPYSYPIFYNGAAIVCFLLLARQVVHQVGGSRRAALSGEVALCALCLTAAVVNRNRQLETPFPPTERLTTDRGTIRVSKHLAEQYQAAIRFMKEKNALGEQVLSVPEDTGLYFFSETQCPTRVYTFDPGVVAPGKMTDELIQQIEKRPVRYLIWSNRTYPEYKAMLFGVDFDQTLGHYFHSHYHRVRILVDNPVPFGEWNAYIWERNAETPPQ